MPPRQLSRTVRVSFELYGAVVSLGVRVQVSPPYVSQRPTRQGVHARAWRTALAPLPPPRATTPSLPCVPPTSNMQVPCQLYGLGAAVAEATTSFLEGYDAAETDDDHDQAASGTIPPGGRDRSHVIA